MKEKMILIISITTIAISFALSGCSKKEYAKQNERTPNVKKLDADQDLNGLKLSDTLPLVGSLESPLLNNTQSACEKVSELIEKHSGVGPQFRVLGAISSTTSKNNEVRYQGGIDIENNPFYQHILGEKAKVPSDEEFMKQAQDLYNKKELSILKFALVKDAYLAKKIIPSAFQFLKRKAVQGKISESFPGAFGKQGDLSTSFVMSLLKKAQIGDILNQQDMQILLTSKLDLFTRGTWEEVGQDIRSSLQAAIYGSNFSGNAFDQKRERLCAFVLWQRSLSQMLRMKGYTTVASSISLEDEKINSKIVELSNEKLEFQKIPVRSIFKNNENQVLALSDEQLASYEPTKSALIPVSKTLQNQTSQNKESNLSKTLSLLEAMTYTLEATSPASDWMQVNPLLGNLEDIKSQAFLPSQMHPLSLGLLSIHLKNLSTFFITDLNAQGAKLKKGEDRKGILIQENQTYKLSDLLKMIRISVYLENTLRQLSIHKDHISYDAKILEKLTSGKDSVMQSMQDLRTPLVLQTMSMIKDQKCVAEVKWNPETGERVVLSTCSPSLEAEAKSTLALLGQAARTPILMKFFNQTQSQEK